MRLKCPQVLSSRLEEDVSTEEDFDQLLHDCRRTVASLRERMLHSKAQNEEQISDSATLEVRLAICKLHYLPVMRFSMHSKQKKRASNE